MVKLLALTEAIKAKHRETRSLMKELHRSNLNEHQKTQALIMGLQDANYSAARLIDLAGKAAQSEAGQAREWLKQALSSLLETQAYFQQREQAEFYVSREYKALVHLSLSTCFIGLNLTKEGIKEIARLVAIPSEGEGLDELPEMHLSPKQNPTTTVNLQETFREIYTWSSALSDERIRLKKLKALAVSTIKTNAKLARLWANKDNEAYGQALLAERELALQAFAVAVSKHQSEITTGTSSVQSEQPSNQKQGLSSIDLHRDEEINTLKRAAKAFGDTKELTKLIKKLASSASTPSKEQVKAARQSFQRVSAEVDPKGMLIADL